MHKPSEKAVYLAISFIVLTICTLTILIPILIVFMSSISEERSVIKYGYTLWPKNFSLEAYDYILTRFDVIGRAYGITIGVTIIGTLASMLISSCLAYALAQHNLPGRKVFMFFVLFTMLFNGGLIPTYYFYTTVFHIKNTYLAYIIPNLLCNAFNVILLRNYFANSVSPALRESAKIDGCSEFKIFWQIIVPLSTPILATIGLLSAIAYWNDWQNALYYIDDAKQASIQQVLRNMTNNISYLANTSNVPSVSRQVPGMTVRMAIAVLSMAPLMAAFPFFESYFVKGITIGAVKE